MSDLATAELAIPLASPVKRRGREVTELILREPIVSQVHPAELDLKPGFAESDLRKYQIKLIAHAAGVPDDLDLVGGLPISKIERAAQYLQDWIDAKGCTVPAEAQESWLMALDKPIVTNAGEVSDLYLHEPSGDQVERASRPKRGQFGPGQVRAYEITLVALVAGVSEVVVRALPITRHVLAVRFIESFFLGGRRTGTI
jgi:hypothetical protein